MNFDLIYNFSNAAHPWLRSESHPIPLDIFIYKLVKSYLHATPFKRAALKVTIVDYIFHLLFNLRSGLLMFMS